MPSGSRLQSVTPWLANLFNLIGLIGATAMTTALRLTILVTIFGFLAHFTGVVDAQEATTYPVSPLCTMDDGEASYTPNEALDLELYTVLVGDVVTEAEIEAATDSNITNFISVAVIEVDGECWKGLNAVGTDVNSIATSIDILWVNLGPAEEIDDIETVQVVTGATSHPGFLSAQECLGYEPGVELTGVEMGTLSTNMGVPWLSGLHINSTPLGADELVDSTSAVMLAVPDDNDQPQCVLVTYSDTDTQIIWVGEGNSDITVTDFATQADAEASNLFGNIIVNADHEIVGTVPFPTAPVQGAWTDLAGSPIDLEYRWDSTNETFSLGHQMGEHDVFIFVYDFGTELQTNTWWDKQDLFPPANGVCYGLESDNYWRAVWPTCQIGGEPQAWDSGSFNFWPEGREGIELSLLPGQYVRIVVAETADGGQILFDETFYVPVTGGGG